MSFIDALAGRSVALQTGSVLLAAGVGVAVAGALFTGYLVLSRDRGTGPRRLTSRLRVSAPVVLALGLSVLTVGVVLYHS